MPPAPHTPRVHHGIAIESSIPEGVASKWNITGRDGGGGREGVVRTAVGDLQQLNKHWKFVFSYKEAQIKTISTLGISPV